MKLGLFSISYAGLWGQDSVALSKFISKAGGLGYDAVMIAGKRPHLSPLDAGEEKLAEIRQALQQAGVTCGAIAVLQGLKITERPLACHLLLLTSNC